MAERDFALPDLGEGLTDGEVLRWLVAAGDTVALNQPIVEIETAKAAVVIPSPFAGTVTALHAAEGDIVNVGAPLLTVETELSATPAGLAASGTPAAGPAAPAPEDSPAAPAEPALVVVDDERQPTLVGPGPREERRRRRIRVPAPAGRGGETVAPMPARPRAAPPVRKYAKDRGIEIDGLLGTGPDGRVTRTDVDRALAGGTPDGARSVPGLDAPRAHIVAGEPGLQLAQAGIDQTSAWIPPAEALPVPRPPRERVEERLPVRGTRRAIAEQMVASKFSIPHVTEFVTVDATALMALRARLRDLPEAADARVTPLAIVGKALCVALRAYGLMNSSWDDATGDIVVKGFVHLGFATDTPSGLVVPNVKDADTLGIVDLAREIVRLSVLARERRATPADLTGGTITITNVGGYGVETGTPIINKPECAIVATGSIAERPWVVDGQLAVRQLMTLAVSFDHRIVDGAYAARFLAHLRDLLEEPGLLAAY